MKLKFLHICIIALAISICSACSGNSSTSSDTTSEPEYENPYKMQQLLDAFHEFDYVAVKEIGKEIIAMYPDTLDEAMAENYIEIVEKIEGSAEEKVADIDFKEYIQLYSVKTTSPNSAGGIDLYIKWKNVSPNTIKYATFECELYNAVDDRVPDDITNSYVFRGKVTGPIETGKIYGTNQYWDCAWWNHSGKYAKIIGIELEYMNGEKIEIPSSRIDELFY